LTAAAVVAVAGVAVMVTVAAAGVVHEPGSATADVTMVGGAVGWKIMLVVGRTGDGTGGQSGLLYRAGGCWRGALSLYNIHLPLAFMQTINRFLYGPTPEDRVRAWQSKLRQESRVLDREMRQVRSLSTND
jgi:hypothetical protein